MPDQASASARRGRLSEVRGLLTTWLVIMVIGSLPGLVFVAIVLGVAHVLGIR